MVGCILLASSKTHTTNLINKMVAPTNSNDRSVWMLGPTKNDFRRARCTVDSLYDVLDPTGKITILAGEHEDKGVLCIVVRNGTAAVNEWNPAYRGVMCIVSQDWNVDLTESDAAAIVAAVVAGMAVWVYNKSIREPAQEIMVPPATNVRKLCELFCGVTPGGENTEYATILGREDTSGTPLVVMGRTRGREEEKNEWIEGLYGPLVVCRGEKQNDQIELGEAPEAAVRAYMSWILSQTPLVE